MDRNAVTLKAVVIKVTKEPKLSFWEKTLNVIDHVTDYVPVVGGIKQAVKCALVGDWKGVAMGLGEAVVDGVLLVTTAGIGNAAKIGTKAAIKITAKVMAKETAEGVAGAQVNEQLGITNPLLQVGVSVLLGVHAKPNIRIGKNWKAKDISDKKYWNGCENIAKQINNHIGGTIHRIDANGLQLGNFKGQSPGWFHHEVVVKDGKVYDAFTGNAGLDIDAYKKQFTYWEEINFGF